MLWLFAALMLGTAGPCGTVAASSAGTYGLMVAAPPPSESVTTDGRIVTVAQTLGDRRFTGITSRYDAATLTLLSSESNGTCCLGAWHSTVARNADGSYDVESEANLPSPDIKDVYKESRPHLELRSDPPVIVGGLFFVPWIRHVTNAPQIVQISFDPMRVRYLTVQDAAGAPYPDGVPARDKALTVLSPPDQTTTLWYDPCTFTLDAYGTRNGYVQLRTALIK